MIPRLTISPVREAHRGQLDQMAKGYFRELMPDGPPYVPQTLDRYWSEPGRHPYLIELDEKPIGFALVWNHPDGVHEMVEFTILAAHRHKGIGTQAAILLFEALGGDWTLGVATHSPGGLDFWRTCLNACDSITDITLGPPKTSCQQASLTFRVLR
jgi:predicted acetyltransferase